MTDLEQILERVETWVPAYGYDGHYEVSNLGNIRSILFRNRNATYKRVEPFVLKQTPTGRYKEYRTVYLSGKRHWVHRIVLQSFGFHGEPEQQVAHLDGNASNNHLDNLKWVSCKENHAHKKQHGTEMQGVNSLNAKLNDAAVVEIRRLYSEGYMQKDLAKMYGVTPGAICDLVHGRTWTHLPKTQSRYVDRKEYERVVHELEQTKKALAATDKRLERLANGEA